MPGLTFTVRLQDIKRLQAEALIVFFYEDSRPLKNLAGELDWLLCGSLSHLLMQRKLRGSLGEVGLLTARGKIPAGKIFMVGLGPEGSVNAEIVRRAAEEAITGVIHAGVTQAAIESVPIGGSFDDRTIPAIVQAARNVSTYSDFNLVLLAPDAAVFEKISRVAGVDRSHPNPAGTVR